jgi:hypothetical protein
MRRRMSLRLITVAIWGFLFSITWAQVGSATAYARDNKLHALFGERPDDPASARENLLLRPARQGVFVFVENSGQQKQTVVVKIMQGTTLLATSKSTVVDAGKTALVSFPKPAMPVDESKLPELTGKEFTVVLDNGAGNAEEQVVKLNVRQPWDYVEAPTVNYNGPAKRLDVKFTRTKIFSTAPRRVALQKPASAAIPGLINPQRIEGTLESPVTEKGEAFLSAEKLEFRPGTTATGATPVGLVYVDVDNYARAFVFEVPFDQANQNNNGGDITLPRLGLLCARYWSTAKPYNVLVQVDRADPNVTVELAFDRANNDTYQDKETFSGPRRKQIYFGAPDDKGTLTFDVRVSDWSTAYDLKGIRGGDKSRRIRARLLVDGIKELQLYNDRRTEGAKTSEIQEMNVDDTPPEKVDIVRPLASRPLVRGTKVPFKATATDPESRITAVYFFAGKKPDDDKLPKDNYPAVLQEDGTYMTEIPVPRNGDIATYSAVAVNGVGMLGFSDPVEFMLISPEMAKTLPPGPGTVKGVVSRGDRPQPNLPVELRDATGAAKMKTTTKRGGVFVFDKVPPGSYQVYCLSTTSNSEDTKPVTVEPDNTVEVNLKLVVR